MRTCGDVVGVVIQHLPFTLGDFQLFGGSATPLEMGGRGGEGLVLKYHKH